MKTISAKYSLSWVNRILDSSGKVVLFITVTICCLSSMAQKSDQIITISGTQFANPLVEKWVSEYTKANPGVAFKFVKSAPQNKPADLNLTVISLTKNELSANENIVKVGRIAVLPVTNFKNKQFARQLKNGIKQEELKNIFLQGEVDTSSDGGAQQKGELPYTVYTQPSQSATANVLIHHFGKTDTELKGILVTGDDKFLIESLLGDSTAVGYSNLGLIYNLHDRTPLAGIRILPIDPDNNGRLKEDEQVYGNLDKLIVFLESSKNKAVPTEELDFSYNTKNGNPLAVDFVNWVAVTGQQYNHQYGFLQTSDEKYTNVSQK